jgi:hypothetical protein
MKLKRDLNETEMKQKQPGQKAEKGMKETPNAASQSARFFRRCFSALSKPCKTPKRTVKKVR